MNFTELDKAIMIGLIIGDGYLDNKGRLQVAHCPQQKEYCIYKAKLLHSVTGGKDIKVDKFSKTWIYKKNDFEIKKSNNEYYRFRRQSNSFLYFRDLMYPNNKKIKDISFFLSELHLLDDNNNTIETPVNIPGTLFVDENGNARSVNLKVVDGTFSRCYLN